MRLGSRKRSPLTTTTFRSDLIVQCWPTPGIALRWAFLFSFTLLAAFKGVCADEPQTWSQGLIREYSGGGLTADLYLQTRHDDGYGVFRQYQISERISYRLDPRLTTNLNYSYFHVLPTVDVSTSNQHRFEWELNPETGISDQLRYRSRNRIEFLYDEDLDPVSPRFRHRSNLEYSTEGRLSGLFTGVEFFYLFKEGEWNQVRYVPCGLRFGITRSVQLSIFPFIQFLKDEDSWEKTFIPSFEFFWNPWTQDPSAGALPLGAGF